LKRPPIPTGELVERDILPYVKARQQGDKPERDKRYTEDKNRMRCMTCSKIIIENDIKLEKIYLKLKR
jgi:hypothetical protein